MSSGQGQSPDTARSTQAESSIPKVDRPQPNPATKNLATRFLSMVRQRLSHREAAEPEHVLQAMAEQHEESTEEGTTETVQERIEDGVVDSPDTTQPSLQEIIERAGLNPEAGVIYSQLIHTGDTVVSIGPNAHIRRDPTLLLAAYQLRESGHLLISDPQTSMTKRSDEVPIVGYGGVETHMTELDGLRQAGVPLAVPEWLGPRSSAQHLRNPDGTDMASDSVDVIMDRDTSPFVLSEWGSGKVRDIDALSQVYKGYARVLREGGRLLLQIPPDTYTTLNGEPVDFQAILTREGFTVTEVDVTNSFEIPLSDNSYGEIKYGGKQQEYTSLVTKSDHGPVLRVGNANRTSQRLYIATKTAVS